LVELRRLVLQSLFNGPVIHTQASTLPVRGRNGVAVPLQSSKVHGGALAYFLDACGHPDSLFHTDDGVVAFTPRWNGPIFKEAAAAPTCSLFPIVPRGGSVAGLNAAAAVEITAANSVLVPPLWVFDHFRVAPLPTALDPQDGADAAGSYSAA
jgi:hypothetical protein